MIILCRGSPSKKKLDKKGCLVKKDQYRTRKAIISYLIMINGQLDVWIRLMDQYRK